MAIVVKKLAHRLTKSMFGCVRPFVSSSGSRKSSEPLHVIVAGSSASKDDLRRVMGNSHNLILKDIDTENNGDDSQLNQSGADSSIDAVLLFYVPHIDEGSVSSNTNSTVVLHKSNARLIREIKDSLKRVVEEDEELDSISNLIRRYRSRIIVIDATHPPEHLTHTIQTHLDNVLVQKRFFAVSKTFLGIMLLTSVYIAFHRVFTASRIVFPASLAGMVFMFSSLLSLQSILPLAQMRALFHCLSYSLGFLKAYMTLFFAPPLVAIPLRLHLLQGSVGLRVLAVTTVGCLLSLVSTGLVAKIIDKGRAPDYTANTSPNDEVAMKVAPIPNLPSPTPFVSSSALALTMAVHPSSPPALRPAAALAFQLLSTLSGFLLSSRAPAGVKKIVHPVLVTAGYTIASLAVQARLQSQGLFDLLQGYYGSNSLSAGRMIAFMLQTAIVSFGLQLFQYQALLRQRSATILLTTLFAAVFGLFSSAVMVSVSSIKSASVGLSLLTRCVTSPLALVGARATGADPSLTALVVVVTGILGASFGQRILAMVGVDDVVHSGLSMGASAHGLGSAAVAHEPRKFSSAVLAMTLTGLWTVVLLAVPAVRSLLTRIALKA